MAGGRSTFAHRLGSGAPVPAVGFAVWIERLALRGPCHQVRRERRLAMGALIMAVPAKGRLQEHAETFFARAGLDLVKPRGARDYRGAVKGLDGVEVAFISAAGITEPLAAGAAHFGITGEDLVREMIPAADDKVVLLEGLGFGHANLVVAVPEAWIDVRDMADLDDVATAFRTRHDRRLRLATRYLNLTRGFFCPPRHRRLPHCREHRRDRRRAGRQLRRELIVNITAPGTTLRRQRPKGCFGRRHPALTGEPTSPPAAQPETRTRWKPRASSSTASRRKGAPACSARCGHGSPAATMNCWRRPKLASAW